MRLNPMRPGPGPGQGPSGIGLILADSSSDTYSRNNFTLQLMNFQTATQQDPWIMNSKQIPSFVPPPSLDNVPLFQFYQLNWNEMTTADKEQLDWLYNADVTQADINNNLTANGYPLIVYFGETQTITPVPERRHFYQVLDNDQLLSDPAAAFGDHWNPAASASRGLLDFDQTVYSASYKENVSLASLTNPTTSPIRMDNIEAIEPMLLAQLSTGAPSCLASGHPEGCDAAVNRACLDACINDAGSPPAPPHPPPPPISSVTDLWPPGTTDPNHMKSLLSQYGNLTTTGRPKNALIILHLFECGPCNMTLDTLGTELKSNPSNVFSTYGIRPYEIMLRCEADIIALNAAQSPYGTYVPTTECLNEMPLQPGDKCPVPVSRCPIQGRSAYYSPEANAEAKSVLNLPTLPPPTTYDKGKTFSPGVYPQAYYYDNDGNITSLLNGCCFNALHESNLAELTGTVSGSGTTIKGALATLLCTLVTDKGLLPPPGC